MRTVKQVSNLTGISVRTLHYYDGIGLLKPAGKSGAGYRLYDDKALETLQQVLFFRGFNIPLKEIKAIMAKPALDRNQILQKLFAKRDRAVDSFEVKEIVGECGFVMKQFSQIKEEKGFMLAQAQYYRNEKNQAHDG